MPDSPAPPTIPARPIELTLHGDTRVDPWFWLRDREDPDVIGYLEAENAYTSAALDHTNELQQKLFEEIRARVQETDVSAPVRYGPWDYFARTFEGRQYAQHGRRPAGAAPGEDETILLDENALAGDSPYFALGGLVIAPSHDLIAYSTDYNGGERHTLRFRDLRTGEDLPDEVEDVYYGLAWCDDSRTILYVRPDDTVRPFQIWRHTLGTGPADDVLVYQEDDERFFVGVARTRSGKYLLIATDSKTTSEVYFLPSDDPGATPQLVEPRTVDMEYAVEHHVDDGRRPLLRADERGRSRGLQDHGDAGGDAGPGALGRGDPPSPRRPRARPRRVRRPSPRLRTRRRPRAAPGARTSRAVTST